MSKVRALKFLVFLLLAVLAPFAEAIVWEDRVLPQPKEMSIEGSLNVRAGDIGYRLRTRREAPVFTSIRYLLDGFAKRGEGAGRVVNISLVLMDEGRGSVPEALVSRLRGLPNSSQAYVILHHYDEVEFVDAPLNLTIAANTPEGLFYGAMTLSQLVKPGDEADYDTRLEVPLADIVDWPDIAQRGEWGVRHEWGWAVERHSRWKLNMNRMGGWSRREFRHNWMNREMATADTDVSDDFFRWINKSGQIIIPNVMHLSHLSLRGWKGISVPVYTEEHPQPKPRYPGFCWSDEGIYEVLTKHMMDMAEIASEFPEGHRDIEVWLSEHLSHMTCYCPDCGGEHWALLESEGIIKAYGAVREKYPDVRLRILLSGGSFEVNDRIIEIAKLHNVGLGLYGGVYEVYMINRNHLIYEELEEFVKAGGKLDVYPALASSVRGLYPASMPQFARFRAKEFADKGLHAVTAYTMGPQFYPLTMAAWGEYTWNADGRPVSDFARAYATITGIAEPELFGRWAEKAGEAAWELATSSYLRWLARGSRGGRSIMDALPEKILEEHEFQEYETIRLDRALEYARGALRLAREAGDPLMIAESRVTLGGIKSIKLWLDIEELMSRQHIFYPAVSEKLNKLDICAELVRSGTYEWNRLTLDALMAQIEAPGHVGAASEWGLIQKWLEELPEMGGLRETYLRPRRREAAHGVMQISDRLRIRGERAGIRDNRGDMAPTEVGAWGADDFDSDGNAVLRIDVSDFVKQGGGSYILTFRRDSGDSCNVESVKVSAVSRATGESRVLSAYEIGYALNWDYLVKAGEREAGEDLNFEIKFSQGDGGSDGRVILRRVWAHEEFPEEEIDRLLE